MASFVKGWVLAALMVIPAADAGAQDWVRFSGKGGVQSYSKEMPGTRVLAMRGESTTDVPIDRVATVFLDGSLSLEWVDLLVGYEEHPAEDGGGIIEYQLYDMPWPIWDRDFVFYRTTTFDPDEKSLLITYRSIEDARYPIEPEMRRVRGIDHGSFWKFTEVEGGTYVEVEAFVDPAGSIPVWLVNMIQRGWPRDSITALVKRARATDIEPKSDLLGW